MIFADLQESFGKFLIYFACAVFIVGHAAKKLFRNVDTEGKIKDAATNGVVDFIKRKVK